MSNGKCEGRVGKFLLPRMPSPLAVFWTIHFPRYNLQKSSPSSESALSELSREFRKSTIDAYKGRKTIGGIYAIRSRDLNTRWIGKAPDLSTIWNRITFQLRSGHYPCATLQEAWSLKGADNFDFEVVEEIDAEELSFALDRVMKERMEYWCGIHTAHRLGS